MLQVAWTCATGVSDRPHSWWACGRRSVWTHGPWGWQCPACRRLPAPSPGYRPPAFELLLHRRITTVTDHKIFHYSILFFHFKIYGSTHVLCYLPLEQIVPSSVRLTRWVRSRLVLFFSDSCFEYTGLYVSICVQAEPKNLNNFLTYQPTITNFLDFNIVLSLPNYNCYDSLIIKISMTQYCH